jgi:hypothetical protein
MAKISNIGVRRAIVAKLETISALTSVVPATRIYGQRSPAGPVWPFVKCGVPIDQPRRAGACMDGQTILVAIHAFAKGADEEVVEAVGTQIAEGLDGAVLPLTSPHTGYARVRYVGGRTQQDDADARSWHRISNFEIRVST